ncbi:glycoside hydrolase family 88 protein [Marinoscillum furvescens]|uniref:Rhamnogalacturonyl hydrolase YesR n=1 Tax=Marinoscillum furvescens DSM 4134 TaxID=1122208 RepID=A0A3D9L6X1_MARFU|nr:glycoside hydrolase family 88 protein [Marinoscillum furvescens]REE00083.1 rhamnogalacturonyl hydrolase YesR [Marinoscillum furvescens DSM 4134]
MDRRTFTNLLMATGIGHMMLTPGIASASGNWLESLTSDLPDNLPENLKNMVEQALDKPYSEMTTNWDGSIQIEGLLRFAKRGHAASYKYATEWFDYRLETDSKMTDEEYFAQYITKARARINRRGPLTFSIYSANLGVAFPVHDLYKLTHNSTARQVCLDVADAILHECARDKYGMVAHDDGNFTRFAIPDTTYWATRANAIAGNLTTGELSEMYYKQAIIQLDTGIDVFLNKDTGLVRTGIFNDEIGQTYWCRSQGWLLWSIVGLLRNLPTDHPRFEYFAEQAELIAKAVRKHQGKNGGLHVLVDDPNSPEEVTGMAMCLSAMKEASREGWITSQYSEFFEKGWDYIQKSVDEQGNVTNVYTAWAKPAEARDVNRMNERFRGFVPGILMVAADEMTK